MINTEVSVRITDSIFSLLDLATTVVANHVDQTDKGENTNEAEHSKEDIPSNCEVTCNYITLGLRAWE